MTLKIEKNICISQGVFRFFLESDNNAIDVSIFFHTLRFIFYKKEIFYEKHHK